MKYLVVLLAFCALPLHAQTTCGSPPADPVARNAARLSYSAPTQNTDGSAITKAITYTVYEGSTAVCTSTGTAIGLTGLSVGVHSWTVTAKTSDGESAKSAPASKTIQAAPPNPPTNLQVDPASLTAYQLVLSNGQIGFLSVGILSPGASCDATQPVGNKYVVDRKYVATWIGNAKPQLVVANCS